MDRLGPFEAAPRLAVAVSGGSDSMALALLARDWARARDGMALALIVDHGLRPESGAEAAMVARWLAKRGLTGHVLTWSGPKPTTGIQEAARAARYARLGAFCRSRGIFHLLLAHQRQDQAETVWMRATRGSGIDGMAGMAALAERRGLRLLRPLLGQDRDALRAGLRAIGQPWVEDPSNADQRFARARLRAAWQAAQAPRADTLLSHAAMAARARRHREAATDSLLGAAVAIHPEGYATLDLGALRHAPGDIAESAFARVLTTIGAGVHAPRWEKCGRLCHALLEGAAGAGATLAGCRIVVRKDGQALVVREAAAAARARCAIAGGETVIWDARFRITLAPGSGRFDLAALAGQEQGQDQSRRGPSPIRIMPAAVKASLPALFDRHGLAEVPHLGWIRAGRHRIRAPRVVRIDFIPPKPLTSPGFNLA